MDFEVIKKYLLFFSISFLIGAILEFLSFFLLINTSLNLNSESTLLYHHYFTSGTTPVFITLSWIALMMINILYVILSCLFFGLRFKNEMDNLIIAKYIIVLGIVVLISSFTHMVYIIVIANSQLNYNGMMISFNTALINQKITPFIALTYWQYFYAITCINLCFGLFITAGGINWSNKIAINIKDTQYNENK